MAVAVAPEKDKSLTEETIYDKKIIVRRYYERTNDDFAQFVTTPEVRNHDIQIGSVTRRLAERLKLEATDPKLGDVEKFRERYLLVREAGLENEARWSLASLARFAYPLFRDSVDVRAELKKDFGFELAAPEHQKAIVEKYRVNFTCGFRLGFGDRREHHLRNFGWSKTDDSWTWDCGGAIGKLPTKNRYWDDYDNYDLPVCILKKIVQLQKNPLIASIHLMIPESASVKEAALVVMTYVYGRYLAARWGEKMDSIPGIDS